MLTKEQFDIIMQLEQNRDAGLPKNEIDQSMLNQLTAARWVSLHDDDTIMITEKGLDVLEMYRVKRAVFIVAGMGTRLYPLTKDRPKSLVEVNGKSMIEDMLETVHNIGIREVVIVRGYLKEKFDFLLEKYPHIIFIDNDKYEEYNNIYSAYLAKDYLENTYIFDGDILLTNKNIIQKYQYHCNYAGIFKKETDDWCLELEGGRVASMKLGGENCYLMYGVSYWDEKAGKQLKQDIIKEIQSDSAKQRYWDEIPTNLYNQNYNVYVRSCEVGDIVEIDTIDDFHAAEELLQRRITLAHN
ncbi:sugar phosphate nucleotidyltransferase [Paenibacillus apiarius]|uniref:Phosphocholine cytidylyltransferase family protein n=1 Tax=Paenibacillus apiarius TaxID=46240 RepID=A0ABT4DWE3_9BACL|nr:phosphocholine cytidylyltransferase family protein [Paenibacillus apiarius]MBN3523855.1 phosphocholine cytidylyltransferase family protein [Paenibacillus apiarius]MCY9514168.1 phosphocholine cytidylyltransferase family protein [Paenibacillus apiarius]MCY9520291.1 phosphocholine cytidylyltransferase family protein [Paenibacillus apiarius]MCY9550367.1 phosphocholine cytidylyltransferase family protein [Paenibacillus apiarius]MCY9557429.1 phosphocholine cytidylyltransferase family protein [Pae